MDINLFLFDDIFTKNEWQMTFAEKMCLLYFLNKIRPEISMEIGTYLGGSLRPISFFSKRAYSIDLEHKQTFKEQFSNVKFISGDSKIIVPKFIHELNKTDESLEFVLIDGDHSEDGVRTDINNILNYKPKKPLYILMHDSFHPDTRRGIETSAWEESPHVHHVEIDFIQGIFHQWHVFYKQMWGGFALAVLLPDKRKEKLSIIKTQELAFQSILAVSVHN